MRRSTKRVLIGIGALVGALIVLRFAAAAVWPTINDVTTGATPEYPDLHTQRFPRPPGEVFNAALATAREMGFEITSQSPEKGEIQAVATTRLLRFKDDVTIRVGRESEVATVNVRSRSRIGKGDLGANARRIRDFQAGLSRRLAT